MVRELDNERARGEGVVKRLDDPLDASTRAYERGRQEGLSRGLDVARTVSQLFDLSLSGLEVIRQSHDHLSGQIDQLAAFIVDEVPGEPSQGQGAVETIIRVHRDAQQALAMYLRDLDAYRETIEREQKRADDWEQRAAEFAKLAGVELVVNDGTGAIDLDADDTPDEG